MLALIAAGLFLLDSFGVGKGWDVDIFKLALAFWAAHFALVVPVPVPMPWARRQRAA